MVGWSGGSIVHAVNGTVTSALTAASSIEGPRLQTDTNSAASINVADLVQAGAVSTSTSSFAIPGGVEVLSHARTAGVSLLGGAIKVDAVDTFATSTYIDGLTSSDTFTTLVGLHVAGKKIPVNIPKNFQINIPNIARLILNVQYTVQQDGAVMTQGAGLYLSLLKPRGQNAIGAEVMLNPTYSAIQLVNPTLNHYVAGHAYGSRITAGVGQLVNIQSDPTAPISMPGGGTNGVTNYNTIAAADLAPLLQVGAVTTSATGTDTSSVLDATTTSEIAGLNLLNGLIKVDAIKVTAHAHGTVNGSGALTSPFTDGSATLVNLIIAGKKISLNTSPNTVINVLNLGTITIDSIQSTSTAILVKALDIKISTAQAGLPVGAEIQLGVASASVH
ncbi:MAG TPA: choice-of-anchor P family protein [Jatrophihabitantaceae bacterium]|jgi:hypothetical protein